MFWNLHNHQMQRVCRSSYTTSLLIFIFLFLGCLAQSLIVSSTAQEQSQSDQLVDAQGGSHSDNTSVIDFVTSINRESHKLRIALSGLRRNQTIHQAHSSSSHHDLPGKKHTSGGSSRRRPSMDCQAKRTEVLSRQSQAKDAAAAAAARAATSTPDTTGYQRLKPNIDSGSLSSTTPSPMVPSESLANYGFEGEHVPECRPDGSYEPIQCHKVGYCWCVNKYGQAIKNSASMSGETPICKPAMYESESDDMLVVAGISKQRMKNLLKVTGSLSDNTTPNGNINFEATESSATTEHNDSEGHQQVESGRHLQEPLMPLLPNDCRTSRTNARERAIRHVNDSIWVPECDEADERYYADRQCHKSRVCWCVDQSTGLPLRTSEQLSARSASSNCTEIKKTLELTSQIARPRQMSTASSSSSPSSSSSSSPETTATNPHQSAFYQGSSEFCDAGKRIDFLAALGNQFRQQISEYLRQNPPTSLAPMDLTSINPYAISDLQVSRWQFNIMDKDKLDGKLDDREWSQFKNNFKLVDKPDELDNPNKQQKSPYFTLAPLLIVRSQRKCWRDFLEFCGSVDLVVDISLSKWLSCTELPPKLPRAETNHKSQQSNRDGLMNVSIENTYAHSREAAIVRSKKKNPFLGILKPD